MATTTIPFSSLTITSSKLNYSKNPLSISVPQLNFSTNYPKRFNLSSKTPKIVSKAASGTETFVRENPAEVIEKIKKFLGEEEAKEVPKERAPRPIVEEVFAVVMIGSRQYIVFPGRWLNTQRLKDAKANDKIVLNKVLLVGTKDKTYIGKPVVTNAVVHAVVEEHLLDDKVIVFKYKAKKNYRRNIGHRQPITRIKITGITGYEDFPFATLEEPQTPETPETPETVSS